ncbi:Utp14 protein-domain-containing protein [Morchella snyderi]|nr:Utp14 protein-domain-containing protein [Morchella snyderi]
MPRPPSTRPPPTGSGSGARSRARNNPKTRSLNAFAIAQSTATRRPSKHTKHTTAAADPGPSSSNKNSRRADSASIDGGSDSDGGHWRVGVGSGDDSESDIDSDEALGASDEERFAGFAFRGSSSSGNNKNKKKEKTDMKKGEVTLDESDDDDDDDGEEEEEEDNGEGFVDLSEMLDRATPSGSESSEDGDEEEEEEEEEAGGKTAGKLQQNRPKKRAAPESESEDDSAGGLDLEEPSMSEADDGDDDGSDSDSKDSFAHFSEEDGDDDDDPAALAALQSRIAALPSGSKHASKRARLDNDPNEGKTPNEYNLAPTSHSKLTVNDLLPTIADRTLKKSLKTLSSDGATTTKSTGMQAGKLAAPLPKRQQDRIDRAAAYVQTTTALGRWAATVKTQREAEHLRFPLPNAPNAPVAAPQRLLTLSATEAGGARGGGQTELEATVSRILRESNMASERKLVEFEELQTNRMSVEEVQRRTAELRMARELLYREELRAKRVKKIKSKAYRRVHKKERARQEQAVEEALALERGGKGEGEKEEEAMERERRRAEERMTLRHKQSRWAKGMRESGRSVWDDEAQEGAVEMARRAEELTRRIRGKGVRGEFGEGGSSSSEDEEDEDEDEDDDAFDEEGVELRRKLVKDIEKAEASLGASAPGAGSRLGGRLMGMKFMQTAEAAKRKENDAQLEELKNMLMDGDRPGGGSEGEDDEDEKEQHKQASGRMTFRPGKKEKEKEKPSAADRSEFEEQDLSGQEQQDEDGEEEEEDEEDDKVTLVNRANAAASSTAPKNPFTAPRTTAGAAGGKHTSFGASNDTAAAAAAAAGNPWLPQDAPPHPQRKQPTLSSSTKTESRTERSSKKLARTRHAALAPAEAEAEVEIDTSATLTLAPKKKPTPADADGDDGEDEDEVDAKDIHLIPAHKGGGKAAQSQRALVRRAFAGDDVVAQFVEEKRAVVAAEGDRVVDERLPGWGSWAGEGLPQTQAQGALDARFVKVVKGVVAPERRKDRRLARVVVNEKRVKKNVKYHASALPHVFETKQQYERSLRIPIGPEWATKTTFQDATMPRVVVKRGVVVEPISAPFK